jgi:hypothetical protein
MPVILKIVQANGQTETIRLPVEIWQRGSVWTLRYASTSRINEVVLDPDNILPDINRKNNQWNAAK